MPSKIDIKITLAAFFISPYFPKYNCQINWVLIFVCFLSKIQNQRQQIHFNVGLYLVQRKDGKSTAITIQLVFNSVNSLYFRFYHSLRQNELKTH